MKSQVICRRVFLPGRFSTLQSFPSAAFAILQVYQAQMLRDMQEGALGCAMEVAAGRRPSPLQPRSLPNGAPETGCSDMTISSFQEMVAGPLLPPLGSLDRASQAVPLGREDHQARLRDPIRTVSSQLLESPLHHGRWQCPCHACGGHQPTGEGCD
ncbi:hypothetical protein PO909_010904 [Leuciscus waleckii]